MRFLLQVQEGEEVPDLGVEAMRKRLVQCGEREGQALLMDRPAPRVYHVRWFSEEFCTLLLEELHNFDAQRLSLRERPNSLNRRGVLLKDLGMDDFFAQFCRRCVAPVAAALFPDYGGTSLDDHYTFTVRRSGGGVLFLSCCCCSAVKMCGAMSLFLALAHATGPVRRRGGSAAWAGLARG